MMLLLLSFGESKEMEICAEIYQIQLRSVVRVRVREDVWVYDVCNVYIHVDVHHDS